MITANESSYRFEDRFGMFYGELEVGSAEAGVWYVRTLLAVLDEEAGCLWEGSDLASLPEYHSTKTDRDARAEWDSAMQQTEMALNAAKVVIETRLPADFDRDRLRYLRVLSEADYAGLTGLVREELGEPAGRIIVELGEAMELKLAVYPWCFARGLIGFLWRESLSKLAIEETPPVDTQESSSKAYTDLAEVSFEVLEIRIRAQNDLLEFVRKTDPDDADELREMAENALRELTAEVSVRNRMNEVIARAGK